jgi:hypothetical protein
MATASNSSWEAEYREAGTCFRTYTEFLIKIVMGFCTGNAILFAALTYLVQGGFKPRLSVILITLTGALASLGAFIIQRRTYAYWLLYLQRASDLEKDRAAQLYTKTCEHAKTRGLKSCLVVQVIYVMFTVFWLAIFLKAIGVSMVSVEL